MKPIALALALILTVLSAVIVLTETCYRDDLRVQRRLARYSAVADQRVHDAAEALRDKGTPAALKEAVELYRDVLSRDRENPYRWCDLGRALQDSQNTVEARRCFEEAVRLGPNNIQTLSHVVEFYLAVHQPKEVFRYAARMLDKDPGSRETIFYQYLQKDLDFGDTLRYGIPANQPVAQAYMRALIRNGDSEKAGLGWTWLASKGYADGAIAGEYASFLIRIGDPAGARNAWMAWAGTRGQPNRLYNPGFEAEPLRSPFDWQLSQTRGVETTRDESVHREGKWSLRVEFDGKENVAYGHASQSVYLEAGKYVLRGWVRTEGITTDKGIGLRANGFMTRQLTGTNDWTLLEQEFEMKEPSLVRIEVFRRSSERFANKIAGIAWIDDLSITLNVER